MTNIKDQAFSGQYAAFRDFEDRVTYVTKEILGEESHTSEDSLDYKLPLLKKTTVKILYIIAREYPDTIQAAEIEHLSGFHRSTIFVHTKELVELNLIEQEILPGTENKFKPTHLYRLKSDVEPEREQIYRFFEAHVQKDPSLALVAGNEPKEPTLLNDNGGLFAVTSDEPASSLSPNPDESLPKPVINEDSGSVGDSDIGQEVLGEDITFEEKVATIINGMAQEIIALRERVSDLEQRLHQKSRHAGQVDFGQAMSLLKKKN